MASPEISKGVLFGQSFGRLIAIGKTAVLKGQDKKRVVCTCSCGCVCFVDPNKLRRGTTQSCGCKRSEIAAKVGKSNIERYNKSMSM